MSSKTKVVYLIGKPGVGKYTIAQALHKNHEYIICDNQLINNPIFTLLNYDGYSKIPEMTWVAIDKIRSVVFDFIAQEHKHNYVLTNCLFEDKEDRLCYSQVEALALKRGSQFIPVKLLLSEEEHLRRITALSRRKHWKSIDPQDVYDTKPLIAIDHSNLLELNISQLSATQVAEQILNHVSDIMKS